MPGNSEPHAERRSGRAGEVVRPWSRSTCESAGKTEQNPARLRAGSLGRGPEATGRIRPRSDPASTNRSRFGPLYDSCGTTDHSIGQCRATVGGSSQSSAGQENGNNSVAGLDLHSKCDFSHPICHLASCACPGLSWAGAITPNYNRLDRR